MYLRKTVNPEHNDHTWDTQKGSCSKGGHRLVHNYLVVLAGLGVQCGRCSEVDFNEGLTLVETDLLSSGKFGAEKCLGSGHLKRTSSTS
jgi:hypothetical protein